MAISMFRALQIKLGSKTTLSERAQLTAAAHPVAVKAAIGVAVGGVGVMAFRAASASFAEFAAEEAAKWERLDERAAARHVELRGAIMAEAALAAARHEAVTTSSTLANTALAELIRRSDEDRKALSDLLSGVAEIHEAASAAEVEAEVAPVSIEAVEDVVVHAP